MMPTQKLCPSAPCSEDAVLLGRIGMDHRVRYLPNRVSVGSAFVENTKAGTKAETRFRFASACVESSCTQWENGRCSVADLARALLADVAADEAGLPKCSIRRDCRWFDQSGIDACQVCPLVTTERAESPPVGAG